MRRTRQNLVPYRVGGSACGQDHERHAACGLTRQRRVPRHDARRADVARDEARLPRLGSTRKQDGHHVIVIVGGFCQIRLHLC